jgi:hypothetical protein
MTTNSTTAPLTGSPGMSGSSGPGDSGTADQAKQAAGTAAQEAKYVASEAKLHAQSLMGEARTQVEDQSRTQRDKLVELLRSFTDELEEMSQERSGMAGQAARQVAGQARTLEQRIDGREPAELLDDLRSFARRRPGTFLAGAAVAGMVVGRLLRGARDANADTGASSRSAGFSGGFSGATDPVVSDAAYGRPEYTGGYSTATGYQGDPLTGDPIDPTAPTTTGSGLPATGTTGEVGTDVYGRPTGAS